VHHDAPLVVVLATDAKGRFGAVDDLPTVGHPKFHKQILVRRTHRRLSGRREAGENLYVRVELTLSGPSIRRANKDELPAIAGFLVHNSLGTGDRV
jgi:hypothetical protein